MGFSPRRRAHFHESYCSSFFGYLLKPARLCGGRPLLGCLGCLLEAPGPSSGGPTPREALQGGGLGRLGLSLGSLRTSFGKPPGSRRHPLLIKMGFSPRRRAHFYEGYCSSFLGYLLKPARLCGGRPLLGCLGCLLEAPGPSSGGPTPREALKGGGLGRLGLSLRSLRTSFGRPPGPQRHPKVAPRTGPI